MAPERLILCSGAQAAPRRPPNAIDLHAYGSAPNVNFKLEHLRRTLWTAIPPVLRDLLDVAIYVYVADQAVPRGNGGRLDANEIGAGWRRALRLRVPVREPDRWNAPAVRGALEAALGFVSEDAWAFEFPHLAHDFPLEDRLDFAATPFHGTVQEVVLFSGGLDSLAGAVHESLVEHRRVLLVNHRSNEKLTPTHEELVRELTALAGDHAPLHAPVWVNKSKALGRETTQRTRSFLFAALGAVFAHMLGLRRVRFYENGVTSLNLPPVGQVVGARASRTTHPRTLAGYETFFSALFERPFGVENCFLWETKTDVVARLVKAGCGALLAKSRSCAHTWQSETLSHPHCGLCSQCIDRRFAVLAAGAGGLDPAQGYAVDLMTGPRGSGDSAMMLSAYLSLVERLERMGRDEFTTAFPELARVLPYLGGSLSVGATRVHDLYARHARQVTGVIDAAISEYAPRVRRRELPAGCLLSLVCSDAGDLTAEPPQPQGNRFERRGDYWEVRFGDGAQNVYKTDLGFTYLRVLLSHPNRSFTPSELETRVRGTRAPRPSDAAVQAVASGELGNGAAEDTALDAEAVDSYRVRLGEIDQELADSSDPDDPLAVLVTQELTAERDQILAHLRRGQGLRGQLRAIGSDVREKVRKRVCAALTRACKHIGRYDPPLAAHFKRPCLNLGNQILYAPPEGTVWPS